MATKSFTELIVWQKAHDFVLAVYRMSARFPREELYGLTAQFRRAVVSIPANIAEGYSKSGVNEKLRFFNIAESSLEECKYFLILAEDLHYAAQGNLFEKAEEVGMLLSGYIKKLKETKHQLADRSKNEG